VKRTLAYSLYVARTVSFRAVVLAGGGGGVEVRFAKAAEQRAERMRVLSRLRASR
jgi:hypothetical protein